MLGENAHGEAVAVVVVAGTVGAPGQRAGLVDQRGHQIGLPDGVDTLQQAQDPLEAGAGVDLRLRKRRAGAVGRLVVLHEDEVPELHEPVARAGSPSGPPSGPNVGPAVDVQLAARAARAGVAHLPEVVLVAETLDPLHRHADDVVPDLLGLVVALVDGDPDAVTVEAPPLRDQLPAVRDRQLLEVVPEAEVAEHLEEHEVALGAPDVVEVVVLAAGPHALLRADRLGERRHLVADEVRLERHHAGDVEQHRRIVRDQARRRHGGVAACGEEVDVRLAELVGGGRRRESFQRRRDHGFAVDADDMALVSLPAGREPDRRAIASGTDGRAARRPARVDLLRGPDRAADVGVRRHVPALQLPLHLRRRVPGHPRRPGARAGAGLLLLRRPLRRRRRRRQTWSRRSCA